ncbi:MAG: hypothetical protein IKX22_00055 [Prevotella sp.]|jgi:hypothetical protein|nr:hypothetical protein [Prevotella sp.]
MKKIETDIREYIRPMTKVVTLETLSDTMDEDWTISAGDDDINSSDTPDDDDDDNRANYFNAWDDMTL